uniref:Caspase domain-containing protein n=1 Tax=Candidatus Kentrum sp. TUN TaxID=2126343 RepID=A0A451A4M6_9GAMM|nr:MAG: Caspase domain-containing protein [Candidatus Kentron sp. TUN]
MEYTIHRFLITVFLLVLGTGTLQSQERGVVLVIENEGGQPEQVELYQESYALVIGVSDYSNWRKLPGVRKDVKAVEKALEEHGFHVKTILDPDRNELDNGFENFISKYGRESQNRLLFYFAGHGHTVKPQWGEKPLGYIVPKNAPDPIQDEAGFEKTAISMQRIKEYALKIRAKHALFLFDSCFSGSLFEINRASSRLVPRHISSRTAEPVRQFITAGKDKQTVPDDSIFRRQFVEALAGEGDVNNDGFLTGAELGTFLFDRVVHYSDGKQHPQHAKIRNEYLDKGDFVFQLPVPKITVAKAKQAPSSKQLTDEATCYDIQVRSAKSFPLALWYTSKSNPSKLPLFRVTFSPKNDCNRRLHSKFRFEVVEGEASLQKKYDPSSAEILTVKPGKKETYSHFPHPALKFLDSALDSANDSESSLRLNWRIYDHKERILDSGTSEFTLLPKSAYPLVPHNIGFDIDNDHFMMATLAAWAQSPAKTISEKSDILKEAFLEKKRQPTLGPPWSNHWLALCYRYFFRSEKTIAVISDPEPLVSPLVETKWRSIFPPAHTLKEGYGDPIEVALLIAAVSKRVSKLTKFHPVLVIAPDGETADRRQYFLAWRAERKGWQAIDLEEVLSVDFQANINKSTPELSKIFDAEQGLESSLKKEGVFIDDTRPIRAIDFDRASEEHNIKGLP